MGGVEAVEGGARDKSGTRSPLSTRDDKGKWIDSARAFLRSIRPNERRAIAEVGATFAQMVSPSAEALREPAPKRDVEWLAALWKDSR